MRGGELMNHIIQYFYRENVKEQSQYGVKEQNYNKKMNIISDVL